MGSADSLPAGGAVTIAAGATLDLGGFDATIGDLSGAGVVALDDATLTAGTDDSTAFSGTIYGNVELIKQGSGTLTLSGPDDASQTAVNAGALQLTDGANLTGAVVDDSLLEINATGTVILGGVLSGSGALIQQGSGTSVLSSVDGFSGSATIDAGVLQITAGTTVAAVTTDDATLAFDQTGTIAVGGAIDGSGNLIVAGGGTIELDATNGYAGGTTLDAGTLVLGTIGAAGSGTIDFGAGANADISFSQANVPGNVISGFVSGDKLDITDLTAGGNQGTLGADNVLSVPISGGGSLTLQLDPGMDYTGFAFPLQPDGASGTNVEAILTQFTVATASDLSAALQSIDVGGAAAAAGTSYTITVASDIALNLALPAINLASGSTLTINGLGNTLDGGGTERGLFAYSGTAIVNDLTIANANASGQAGGAGYWGGGGGAGLGGGLFVASNADVALNNVSFSNDQAVGGAGGSGYAGRGFGGGMGVGGIGAPAGGFGMGGGNYQAGGFGGGGGAAYFGAGSGGFGGGGGAAIYGAGAGNFGAANGGSGEGSGPVPGGAGLGAGGDIFVQQGGGLVFQNGSLSGGTVTSGGPGAGAFGAGIFLQGDAAITLAPQVGQTISIDDAIADQSGADPGNVYNDPADGELILGGSGTVALNGSNTFAGTITFDGDPLLQLGSAAFAGDNLPNLIDGFTAGDTIDLTGLTFESGATASIAGGTLTVTSGAISDTLPIDGLADGTPFVAGPDNGTGTEFALCFCAGTLIRTPSGEVAVERLLVGDLVVTASYTVRPIEWIGTGRVLATRGRRNAATPVIVKKSALDDNVPVRDLHVTKGHALLIDGALIPVEELVNHRTILWDDQAQEVELYHIELATHDVLLANGAPAESYRDDGNRWLFRNANSGWGLAQQEPCAPLLTGGPIVDEAWRRLLDRAGPRPSTPLTDEPDLHLMIEGTRLDAATRDRGTYVFRLAGRPGTARIVSRAVVPQELGLARDPRSLGVTLRQITLWQGTRCRVVDADDATLADGFHDYEADDAIRWTDGAAVLPATLFEGIDGPFDLILHIAGGTSYLADADNRMVA